MDFCNMEDFSEHGLFLDKITGAARVVPSFLGLSSSMTIVLLSAMFVY